MISHPRNSGLMTLLLLWLSAASFISNVSALLEEQFVAFSESDGAVPIHNAVIVHDAQDPAGVQIASRALVGDLEQITGSKPRNLTFDDGLGSGNGTVETAILIGTVESQLIQAVVDNSDLDVNPLEGKWESFTTTLVSEPLEGIREALVIVGSDMRGTAFGVYTLAEQCGQSP